MEESKQVPEETKVIEIDSQNGSPEFPGTENQESKPEELPEVRLIAEEIYPKAKRPKFVNWFRMWGYILTFQCTRRLYKAHLGLDASEVQTKRMVKERMEMADAVNQLEHQQQQSGLHLQSEFFIPQYVGAEQKKIEEEGQMTNIYYTLGDLRLVKDEGARWLIANQKTGNSFLVELENLYIGIIVLQSMGADINFDTVTGDNPAMKELQEKLGKDIELG